MEIESDDPIIQTIPIFLNRLQDPPSCTGEMSLLQFPLRPRDRPYGDEGQLVNVQVAAVASRATRLRMSYELKTNPEHYDSQAEFAVGERHLVSKLVPDSSVAGLALGVIDEGELTLVPLASVNQLRPEFNYVNSDAVGAPPNEAVTLTSKQQHLYQIAQQLLETRGDNLQWTDADFYEEDAQETEDLFLEHIVVNSGHVRTNFPQKRSQLDLQEDKMNYVRALAGAVVAEGSQTTQAGSLDLSRLNVDKQVEVIMKNNPVVTHDQLLELLHPNVRLHCEEDRLMSAIAATAFLVKGFWVAKSQYTAIKAGLWGARDIILLACSKGADLNEHFLGKYLAGASEGEVEEILRPLCAVDSGRKVWKWRHGVFAGFAERFPEEVVKQGKLLDDHIRMGMNLGSSAGAAAAAAAAGAGGVTTQLSHTEKTVKDLLVQQASSYEEVKKALQSVTKDKEVLDQVVLETLARLGATEIRPRWFCLPVGCLGEATLDGYRGILIEIYRVQDKVNKMQILEQIKASTGRECELTDHDLRKLIKEFAKLERGYWSFRGALKQEHEQ